MTLVLCRDTLVWRQQHSIMLTRRRQPKQLQVRLITILGQHQNTPVKPYFQLQRMHPFQLLGVSLPTLLGQNCAKITLAGTYLHQQRISHYRPVEYGQAQDISNVGQWPTLA